LYCGGGYGGQGGGVNGGSTYGWAALPLSPGSPGGYRVRGGTVGAGGSSVAGKGGGAIHLLAGGQVVVDGLLTANGYPGDYYYGSGGSGGAILVAAPRFGGHGTLQASSSLFSAAYSSGGGGRIAVWHHLPPSTVVQRIATTNMTGLAWSPAYTSFEGMLDVGVPTSTTHPQAEAGTAGFYTIGGTLILLR
jgi:hypothetical protein